MTGPLSGRQALVAGGLVAAGAVVLTLTLWPDGDGPAGGGPGERDRTDVTPPAATTPVSPSAPHSDDPSPRPSPSSYPLSRAPSVIPAVREHKAARGPGWRPADGGRVVVAKADAERLADEGRLLAGELKLAYREGVKARAGDVELALVSGKANREAYTLSVKDRRARISGTGEAGVFYGTRTLKQAVRADGTAPEGVVRDRPAKPQRGFMLDTARKHFTARWIESRVRELADLKYNQLGLHFSDDQAFRIESDSHPEVVSAQRLTKAEVRRIVDLAARLHITVIPEIDSPGHLGAVLKAHPDLQLRDTRGQPARGAVDISKPGAARIVDDLLSEYAELFPGAYWHLGADEYLALTVRDPEASYPQLARLAREKYGPGARVRDLATGWLNDRADEVRQYGKQPKAWNDGFFRGGTVAAAGDIEVEYWTGKELGAREPLEYLNAGRKLVNLNDEYLYYVLGEPNEFRYPTGQRIYEQWNPLVLRGSRPVPTRFDGQILGARLAVWCDLADAQTPAQVAAGVRMPLRALAQKVWDPRQPSMPWAQFVRLAGKLD
ncbi:glycoside hydrolase family 20 protein [Streptomyces sp. E11-3]|uniref:beta-N-acetylhexosaminidase n=1 Tax=Streptomyces sp. E11-3 TaxID=3110112 RepID=UPI00397F1464